MEKVVNIEDIKEYDLIKKAVEKFGVQHDTIEFIRHNENLTLKVNDKYLLRIHKPADSFQAVTQYISINIKKMREAEISFLQHFFIKME